MEQPETEQPGGDCFGERCTGRVPPLSRALVTSSNCDGLCPQRAVLTLCWPPPHPACYSNALNVNMRLSTQAVAVSASMSITWGRRQLSLGFQLPSTNSIWQLVEEVRRRCLAGAVEPACALNALGRPGD